MGEPIRMFVEFQVEYTDSDTPFDPRTAYGTLVAGETKEDAIIYSPEEFCRKSLRESPEIVCLTFRNYFIIREGKDFLNTGVEVISVEDFKEMFRVNNFIEVTP